jgi:hypothetical protein
MAVTPHRPCDEHGIVSMAGQTAIRRVHGKVFDALMWSVIVVLTGIAWMTYWNHHVCSV